MREQLTMHVSATIAASLTAQGLSEQSNLPAGYAIDSVEQIAGRAGAIGNNRLVQICIGVECSKSSTTAWSPETVKSELSRAIKAVYHRSLPTSADTPVYIKHPRGFSVSSRSLAVLRRDGLSDSDATRFSESGKDAFDFEQHLWFREGVSAAMVSHAEPTNAEWGDIGRSIDAAHSAMSRLQTRKDNR